MENNLEVPKPENSGSDGQQVKAEDSEQSAELQPVGRPLASAITGLAASHSRALGGEVASTLIAGATSQMATELEQTRSDLAKEREKNEELYKTLSEEKIRGAVLSERISSFRSSRHLKNIGIAFGSLIFGVGAQLTNDGSIAPGIAGIAIGMILMIFSWASAPKGGDA